jgi:hypothetical protein
LVAINVIITKRKTQELNTPILYLFAGIAMLQIGKYKYPNQVTFAEALKIAQIAISKYEGKMSNKDMAEALGYKVKDPAAISGYIFRKFDDVCAYGLMKRQRGFVRVTEIAEEALDPYDTRKAQDGKAKAIRQIPIVNDAFTQWNGEVPSETAFPAKLTEFRDISWQEAQKHSESLRKLFSEVFPYLKSTPAMPPSTPRTIAGVGGEEMEMDTESAGNMTLSAKGWNFGFTKTLPFTQNGINEMKKLVEFLESQIPKTEEEKKTKKQ